MNLVCEYLSRFFFWRPCILLYKARSEREQPLFILVCLLKVFLFSLLFYSRLSESPRVRAVRDIHLHGK